MILLKANEELKSTFQKIIKTIDKEINWDETFFITNSQLILPGNRRSLLFDFDKQRAISTVLDLPLENIQKLPIKENHLLENSLNMTLYAFGKWGEIKGMKVEKDFDRLNVLINGILAQIDINAGLTRESFRFYEGGIEITYEEVVQKIIDDSPIVEEEEYQNEEETEYEIGLWHKIIWKSGNFRFEKSQLNQKDKLKYRLGNNFYIVNYNCPKCGEKMYLVIFPTKKEYRIDTPDGGVYLTRAYSCNVCNMYFTPVPEKHLIDGQVYYLDFEDDKTAYRDYLEVLGKDGARTSNCNFNMYESEYNKIIESYDPQEEKLEEIIKNIDKMTFEEVKELEEKMDSGFFPSKKVAKFSGAVRKFIEEKKDVKKTVKTITEPKKVKASEATKKKIKEIIHESDDYFIKRINNLDKQQLKDFKELILSEESLTEEERKIFQDKIDKEIYKDKLKILDEKVNSSIGKSYHRIVETMHEIQRGAYPDGMKPSYIKKLKEMAEIQGKEELEEIIRTIPVNINKIQYRQLLEKINTFEEIDNVHYIKKIEEIWDKKEIEEIKSIIKTISPRSRNSYYELYQKIREQKFETRNSDPYLEKIYKKVTELDKSIIEKVYLANKPISFSEGLKAYEIISEGVFLPELKSNVLEMLDKRLTKMKMEECEQLISKLKKELNWLGEGEKGLNFYNLKKENDTSVENALNRYGVMRGKYEYPILINDYTSKKTGLKGFILTPDHIFYNNSLSSGIIDVVSINEVFEDKNIILNLNTGSRVKLKTRLKENEKRAFADALNEFVTYLIEKPESRSVDYMAEEKHEIKCCYRCGNIYREEKECPKCGAKFNY